MCLYFVIKIVPLDLSVKAKAILIGALILIVHFWFKIQCSVPVLSPLPFPKLSKYFSDCRPPPHHSGLKNQNLNNRYRSLTFYAFTLS